MWLALVFAVAGAVLLASAQWVLGCALLALTLVCAVGAQIYSGGYKADRKFVKEFTEMEEITGELKALIGGGLLEKILERTTASNKDMLADALAGISAKAKALVGRGDYAGARELHEEVLTVRQRVFGEDDVTTLTAMGDLAQTLRALGRYDRARALGERLAAGRRRTLAQEHPDTLTAMHDLSLTLGDQGDHAGARELQEQVLDARERTLGKQHPDTLTVMHDLASTLANHGDIARARDLQERVLDAWERVFGKEDPQTLRCYTRPLPDPGSPG